MSFTIPKSPLAILCHGCWHLHMALDCRIYLNLTIITSKSLKDQFLSAPLKGGFVLDVESPIPLVLLGSLLPSLLGLFPLV